MGRLHTSERTRCTICSPVPVGIASATSSMPAFATASSIRASVDSRGCQPPRGGEIAAHVAVFTWIGRPTVTGSDWSRSALCNRRIRSSSDLTGTTTSKDTWSVSAKVRRPSTVGLSSNSPAG